MAEDAPEGHASSEPWTARPSAPEPPTSAKAPASPDETSVGEWACFIGLVVAGLMAVNALLPDTDDPGTWFGRAVVLGALSFAGFMLAVSTPSGQRRAKQREELARERTTQWNEQLVAWGYDASRMEAGTWPPEGFATYDVKMGSHLAGEETPPWSQLYMQLAPPGRPELAARMATFQPGPPVDIPVADIVRLDARSRSGAWFGFGASGAAAAHVASSLDYHLAGYELVLVTTTGWNLYLRALGGSPPLTQLATIQGRQSGAPY